MENYHLQENVDYTFLTTQEAISIFADVDYALKVEDISKSVLHKVNYSLLLKGIMIN